MDIFKITKFYSQEWETNRYWFGMIQTLTARKTRYIKMRSIKWAIPISITLMILPRLLNSWNLFRKVKSIQRNIAACCWHLELEAENLLRYLMLTILSLSLSVLCLLRMLLHTRHGHLNTKSWITVKMLSWPSVDSEIC